MARGLDQAWDLGKARKQIIRFFFVVARIDEAGVGDGGDAHVRGLRRSDAGKGILDDKAGVGGDIKFFRGAQVDIGMRFAAFDFFAGHYDFEELRQFMPIEEWTSGCSHGAGSKSEPDGRIHLPQLLQNLPGGGKRVDAVGKELGRDFSAPLHHSLGGDR